MLVFRFTKWVALSLLVIAGGCDNSSQRIPAGDTATVDPTLASPEASAVSTAVIITQSYDQAAMKHAGLNRIDSATSEQLEQVIHSYDWASTTVFPTVSLARSSADPTYVKVTVQTERPGVIEVLWQKTDGDNRFLRTARLSDKEQLLTLMQTYLSSGDISANAEWTTEN